MKEQIKQSESKETISLGGNIELNGFQNLEKAKLIVLKKIIGNYAKQMQEKRDDYKKLVVTLEEDKTNSKIKAELIAGNNSIKGNDVENNIFIAIDGALKEIIEQI